MQIVDNKLLLFRTRDPSRYTLIPKSSNLGEIAPGIYEIAVNWGLDEARVLRNMGVRGIPSPIQGSYNWPGRFKPFDHQIATASFLTMNDRAFVFNEAGTGKTISCLWAADYLMTKRRVRRALIICPLSIMEAAWMKDIMQTVIHRSAVIAHASSMDKRKELIGRGDPFVIINYDGVEGVLDAILEDERFDLVVCDEANFIKNPSTRRWKAVNKLVKPHVKVWAMTGTPSPQSPVDAYGLAKLVVPSNVPRFSSAWRDMVMLKVTQFKWVPKSEAPALVHAALQPAIRYTKEMCLDLPPVLTVERVVSMTRQQEAYYRAMKKDAIISAAGETITAVNAATVINKLLQISAGAAYTDGKETIVFDCRSRLDALEEILNETTRKVLIFAPYRSSIDTIIDFLKKLEISAKEITGDVSATDRGTTFNDFQTKPDPRVLVIQPQAAAHGVTLTAADTVVFWGPVTSVETYIQCIARADRIGQKGANVTVHHLYSSDVEARMFKLLQSRVDDHASIVKLYEDEMSNTKP